MSGIGKGTTTASIGKILQSRGFKVTAVKIDPYINVDAGTMNPIEHGEVFVTDDGDETDQDIGNYERFLDQDITTDNYMTTGRVYETVIHKERNLDYGGKCVEVVPHIPEEVIRRIEKVARRGYDFVLIEVGGTVGEYQNILFLEAARMMKIKHPGDVLFVLVSYLPIPAKIGEMKTKPTQYAARTLNSAGIQPDFIICRSEKPLDKPRKQKISIFCNIQPEDVISAPDADSIYEIPVNFEKDKIGERILNKFGLKCGKKDLKDYKKLNQTVKRVKRQVTIGIIGKYFATGKFVLSDAYISVIEAVKHACWGHKRKPEILWLNSEEYEQDKKKLNELKKLDGIIIPGGFGSRGVKGKILVIQYARKNNVPYLGLCYGMQLATVEFARNVCGMRGAHTTEIESDTKYPVIHVMPDQEKKLLARDYGGTMRLGAWPCVLKKGTKSSKAYGQRKIEERHRHRYELNNKYRERLEKKGLNIAGTSPDGKLVEIIELPKHKFFVGVQFHPEFKSRPLRPHPLFREFVKAAIS
ncbi:CTP synthase [Candidatus Parcubacteria bacterium]|nr:CTP synthase [Candidatus Parcubacteria bacterium]